MDIKIEYSFFAEKGVMEAVPFLGENYNEEEDVVQVSEHNIIASRGYRPMLPGS